MVNADLRRRNLAALRAFQPEAADVVEAAPIPAGVIEVQGRDGSATFRVPDADGVPRWFGGSSMPSVSVAELWGGFCSNGENVAMPGVRTGLEPIFIVSRLPQHCALFVLEPDAVAACLAFCLYDYADWIARGQLVFMLGADLHNGLRDFFSARPGYRMPATFLPAPHQTSSEITALQRELEHAAPLVTAIQEQAMEDVRARLGKGNGPRTSDRPRVAVVTTDAGAMTRVQAERVVGALAELAWAHETCIPDGPEKCHIVARMEAVARADPDLVFALNCPSGSISAFLPRELPVVSWTLPGTASFCVESMASNEFGFASCRGDRARWPTSQRVRECAVAASRPPADWVRRRSGTARAAVFMDLPEVRAEALNITLPSHVAFWHSLLEQSAGGEHRGDKPVAKTWFDRAVQESGTALHDGQVREYFLDLIRGRIVPYSAGLRAARTLVQAGFNTSTWGANWPVVHQTSGRGPIPLGRDLWHALGETELAVFPDPTLFFVQTGLDALSIGTDALFRGTSRWFVEEHGGLEEVAPFLAFYESSSELVEAARRLRYDADGASAKRRQTAALLVSRRHSMAARLQTMAEIMQRGAVPCGPS